MTDTDTDIAIETIPIERITVLNPRVRDAAKFAEIVDSIDRVGFKQPIKVSRTRSDDGEVAYNLVYGQGRMEAFLALGQTEIPAIVTDLSEQDSLLESLVENIARRRPRPGALFRAIGDLAGLGYSNQEIATKIGYSAEHVGKLRRLQEGRGRAAADRRRSRKDTAPARHRHFGGGRRAGAGDSRRSLRERRAGAQANAGRQAHGRASPALRQGAEIASRQAKVTRETGRCRRPATSRRQ